MKVLVDTNVILEVILQREQISSEGYGFEETIQN